MGLACPTLGNLLVDEDTNEEEAQDTEDAKDEDDTGLPVGPILLALDEFTHGVLATGEEESVNCGHFALLRTKDSAREAG